MVLYQNVCDTLIGTVLVFNKLIYSQRLDTLFFGLCFFDTDVLIIIEVDYYAQILNIHRIEPLKSDKKSETSCVSGD